jgi:NAD(P)-dependent dehydrogenase (short-subunit alcohol dehydrogenase family)
MQGGTLLDVTEAQFDQTFEVNVKGSFFLIQEAVRQQLFVDNATIVVVASIVNQKGRPGFTIYAASKAALSSVVRSLSLELIGSGIRMNAVSPGPVNVGLSTKLPETVRREISEKSPLKRFAEADEVAQAILFLASDESAYLVGAELVVDGGISLRP